MAHPGGRPLKFPTPEARRALWEKLCRHLQQGYSLGCFSECDEETLYSYCERFPDDCPEEEFNQAKKDCVKFWEGIGIAGVTGKLEKFGQAAWIFNMKNRAGWTDRMEQIVKDGGKHSSAPPEPGKATEAYLAATKE